MRNELAKLTQATILLAEARTLDEVREIRNLASMAEAYAKAERLGKEAQDYAAEIRLLAGRRAGEVLIQAKEAGEIREGNPNKLSQPATVKLNDLGISRQQSSDWQAMASANQWEFEQAIEEGKQTGRTSDRAVADQLRQSNAPSPGPPQWNDSQEHRRDMVVNHGLTVTANMKTDLALIDWAKKNNLFVRVDRMSPWGNPFRLGDDGDRQEVVENYHAQLALPFD